MRRAQKFYTHPVFRVLSFYMLTVLTLILSGRYIMVAAAVTLLLSWLFTRWDRLPAGAVGLAPSRHTLPRFFSGLAGGLLMASLQPACLLLWGHLRLQPMHFTVTLAIQPLIYFAAAFREELVFRGYPLRRLDQRFGPVTAQIIMFVLFVLEHRLSGMGWLASVIGPGAGSLLFGYASLKSRGLALPLGLHFAWNVGQWTAGFKGEPGAFKAIVDNGYASQAELLGFAAYLAAVILAAIVIHLWYRDDKVSA